MSRVLSEKLAFPIRVQRWGNAFPALCAALIRCLAFVLGSTAHQERLVTLGDGLVRVRCRVYLNSTALHMEFCVADYKGKAFFCLAYLLPWITDLPIIVFS